MKLLLPVFVLFLLAFAGLGAGLILKRRGLRGGCGHAAKETPECRCESELDDNVRGQCNQQKNIPPNGS